MEEEWGLEVVDCFWGELLPLNGGLLLRVPLVLRAVREEEEELGLGLSCLSVLLVEESPRDREVERD